MLKNNQGFAPILGALIALALVAVMMVVATPLGSQLNRGSVYRAQTDLSYYRQTVQEMLIDNVSIGKTIGLTVDDSGNYSDITTDATENFINILNTYLSEAYQIDTTTGLSEKADPWGTPYEIYITPVNLEYDKTAETVTKFTGSGTNPSLDTEFRVIVRSCGPNATVPRADTDNIGIEDTSVYDDDDGIVVIQIINGTVSSGLWFDKDKTQVAFNGGDTPDYKLATAYVYS